MGTTESLFLEEEVPPHGNQGSTSGLPSSPVSSVRQHASQPQQQEKQQQQSRQKPKKKLPPIKRISGLIIGKPGTGKRTLLQRLDGIDPFDNPENDNKSISSTVTLPYICPPNSKSWDRILFQARASEVVNCKSDFSFILLHPEHDLEATKAYVCAVVADILKYSGYTKDGDSSKETDSCSEPICICVLFNFRDRQNTDDSPQLQKAAQQWITEILQPTVAKENILLRFIPTSLKNRYGLSIVHNVIYEVYLQRRKADLISKLKATTAQIQNTKQPSLMSYEAFEKTLVLNPNINRRDPQVSKRRQLTPRMQSNKQRDDDDAHNQNPQPQLSRPTQQIENYDKTQRVAEGKKKGAPVPSSRPPRTGKYQQKQKKASAPMSLEAFLASSSEEDEPASQPKRVASVNTFQSSDDDDDFYYDDRGHKRFSYTHHHLSEDSDSSSSDDDGYMVHSKKELTSTSTAKHGATPGSSKDNYAPVKVSKKAETQAVMSNHRDVLNPKDSKSPASGKNKPRSDNKDDTISHRDRANPLEKQRENTPRPSESPAANTATSPKAGSPKTRTREEESDRDGDDFVVYGAQMETAETTEKKHGASQTTAQNPVKANFNVKKDVDVDDAGSRYKSDDQVDEKQVTSISEITKTVTHVNEGHKEDIETSSQESPSSSLQEIGDESKQAIAGRISEEKSEEAVTLSQEHLPPSRQHNIKDETSGKGVNKDSGTETPAPSSPSPKEYIRERHDGENDNDDGPQSSPSITDRNDALPPTSNPTPPQLEPAAHAVNGDDDSDEEGVMIGGQPHTDDVDNDGDDDGFVIKTTAETSGTAVPPASLLPKAVAPAVHNYGDSDDEGFMIGSTQPQTGVGDGDDYDGFGINSTADVDRGSTGVPPPMPSAATQKQAPATPNTTVTIPAASVSNDSASAAPSSRGLSSAALAAIAAAQKEAETMMMATNTDEGLDHDGRRPKPKKKKKSEKKEKKKKKKKDKSSSGGDVSP